MQVTNPPVMIDIDEALQQWFGFREFKPGQREVVECLLSGRSALAIFPTGGGKSLCYQLPALLLDGVTLVVSPLIALMKDQIDFLTSRGIVAARMDSSMTAEESREVASKARSGELKLLYVAPERLNNERFLAMLRQTRISLFAVDEAHCISEWGHNFRPDYLKLAETAKVLKVERILALTATATPQVAEDIRSSFDIRPDCTASTGFFRPNLHLNITGVTKKERDQVLLDRLRSLPAGPTIVYVTLQKTAEAVAARLDEAGLKAKAYHAGMQNEERAEVQEWWKEGSDRIVVATIALGMGIDKADVRYVYHYNLPKSLESYSQEIGRAGRDGKTSLVEMFACADDIPVLENFVYGDTPSETALRGLVTELLSLGDSFDVSVYDLSSRHDLRQLVLRTALTYLEIMGIFLQGTPYYAAYKFRTLLMSEDRIVATFKGEPAQLVRSLFQVATQKTTWFYLNPDEAAVKLGKERSRVVRALEYLEQHGMIQLAASDVRSRFTRLRSDVASVDLATELARKFQQREASDIIRLNQMLGLVGLTTCLSNALAEHFGEKRDLPCGECGICHGSDPTVLLPASNADLHGKLDKQQLIALQDQYHLALGEPRQAARFLCGLTSPAAVRVKLSRHALYGALDSYSFVDVMTWCAEIGESKLGTQGS